MGARWRVLIVDDDGATRLALENVLRVAGFDVHLAESGCQALDLLDRQRLDAAVIDVMMPRLDGVGVMSALLAREPPERPAVLFVISAQAELRRGPGDRAVRRVFPKPVDAVRLAAELARELGGPHR